MDQSNLKQYKIWMHLSCFYWTSWEECSVGEKYIELRKLSHIPDENFHNLCRVCK